MGILAGALALLSALSLGFVSPGRASAARTDPCGVLPVCFPGSGPAPTPSDATDRPPPDSTAAPSDGSGTDGTSQPAPTDVSAMAPPPVRYTPAPTIDPALIAPSPIFPSDAPSAPPSPGPDGAASEPALASTGAAHPGPGLEGPVTFLIALLAVVTLGSVLVALRVR